MSALSIWIGRGASLLPADIALALIPSLPRQQLERLVQQLIDRMDEADGDTDLEPEETDHTGGEDDCSQTFHDGPGCPIADAGGQMDEDGHNTGEAFFAMHGLRYDGPGCPIADPGGHGNGEGTETRLLPPPTYDGEDQSFILLPAPKGIEPTRYRVS